MPTKEFFSQADRNGEQDQIRLGGGDDIVFAFDDELSLFGYSINGFKGSDTIHGSDFVSNTGEGDTLIGGEGNDTVFGGAGEDTIYGGNTDGSDTVKGPTEAATNTLVGEGVRDPVTDALLGRAAISGNFVGYGDTIFGGNGGTNHIYGEMVGIELLADASFTGGGDNLTGGVDSQNFIYGDVGFGADELDPEGPMYVREGASFTGGDDTIIGGAGTGSLTADNEIYGDAAGTIFLTANDTALPTVTGGNDVITNGTGAQNETYGDFNQVTLANKNHVVGGDDTITGGDANAEFSNQNLLYGDARTAFFTGDGTGQVFQGGSDTLTGGDGSTGTIYGDVRSANPTAGATFQGGNDTITGGANGPSFGADYTLIGDAASASGAGAFMGGNDIMTGGANAINEIYGDFLSANPAAGATFQGGNDTITGGANGPGLGTDNTLSGDAASVSGEGAFIGGNDIMTGGANAVNLIYGDVQSVDNAANVTGGNDTIHAGVGGAQNTIYGDFNSVVPVDENSVIQGGDDVIYGAAGTTDVIWGDWVATLNVGATTVTGSDTFVFGPGGGLDAIMDFESGKDQVDLSGFGLELDSNEDGFFTFDDLDPFWANLGGDLALDFDRDGDLTDDVLLFDRIAYTTPDDPAFGLTADDFLFA